MPRTGMTPSEIREKALDSALRRLRQVGFEKVRLVDVAKDLGVSHAALYAHFRDKSALLDSLSERWLTAMDAALEEIAHRPKDPLQNIHDWFQKFHHLKREKVQNDPELFKGLSLAGVAEKAFAKTHMANLRGHLVHMLKEAMAAKKIAKDSPEKVAQLLFDATMAFHHPRVLADGPLEKRDAQLRKILELLLAGLK